MSAKKEEAPKRYRWLRVKTIAAETGLSDDTVRKIVATGELKAKRSGPGRNASILIREDWYQEWLENLPDAAD